MKIYVNWTAAMVMSTARCAAKRALPFRFEAAARLDLLNARRERCAGNREEF